MADAIYIGGTVITVDDAMPSAEALAIKDGLIVAVGTAAEVMAMRADHTRVVDIGGLTIVPGFIDGHAHLGGLGAQAVGANLLAPPDGNVETIDDLVEALLEFAAGPDVDRTGWIFGMGYDDAMLAEGRHPTADDLDLVSTEIPVMAVHISGHFSVINGAGLAKVGYTIDTEDPEGGLIRRRPGTKEPNGVLEELASIPLTVATISPAKKEDQTYFMQRAQEMAMRFGYTTAQEGRAFQAQHDAIVDFAESGLLQIDVVSYLDYANKRVIESEWHSPDYRNRYRIGGIKVTLDGSPQGRTAWRTTPYLIPPDGQPEDYRGYPAIPDDSVVAALYDEAFAKGWQVLTHANGDAAIDQFIRAMRPALAKYGPADRRPVLIHGQFVRQDQLDALKEIDAMPSLFPMHTFYWGDWYEEIIGAELAQQISPMRSVLDRGMLVTSHTDAPVALPNLMQVMSATVNRTSRSGKVIGPDERLTPWEALKTITIWGAYQHFEEDRKGSIEVGKLADLVLLSENPLTIDAARINQIVVVETIKEGKTVFRAE
jgi:predicted amidohydrolase YtcJ